MSEPNPAMGRCPDCRAENPVTAGKCWMCGRTAWVAAEGARPAAPPVVATDIWLPDTTASTPQAKAGHETTIALSMLVLIVTVGLWLYEPWLGLLMLIVIDLPLAITVSASLLREARFRRAVEAAPRVTIEGVERPVLREPVRPMSGGEKVGTFLKWMGVMAASVMFMAAVALVIIAAMVASAVVALAQMCGCTPK